MRARQAAPWLVLAYYAVSGWPGDSPSIAAGLDESWIYAMNALYHAGPVFGSEVSFTLGPLGFLLTPRAVDGNLARGLTFWIALHLAGVALLAFALRRGRAWQVCGMVALTVLAQTLGVWADYWAAINVGLFAIASLLLPGPGWPWAVAAGLLAGILAGVKLTSGAAALSIAVFALVVLPASVDRKRRMAIIVASIAASVWLGIYSSFFASPAAFLRWLKWSSEISWGYPVAMSVIFQPETLWNALAVGVSYALFMFAVGSRQRRLVIVFLPLLFITFRHGYVRQGAHSTAFYGTACAIPALLCFFTENRKERIAVLGLAGACAAVMLVHCNRPGSPVPRGWANSWDYLSLRKGVRCIGQTLNIAEVSERLEKRGQGAASLGGPPGRWPEVIRGDFGRVASLPYEISALGATGIAWQLLPSLQLYSAYTAELDRATAAVFAGKDRPKWIWLMNEEIDGRTQMTDNPETWLAILDHYAVAATHDQRNQMLLRAESDGVVTRTGPIVRQTVATAGEWIEAEDSGRLWRVEIELQPTTWGRLARYVYQWPAVRMEVERTSGTPWRIRILPDTAPTGLLMPLVPGSLGELSAAFENRVANPVKRFRILLPEGGYFKPRLQLRWRQTSRVLAAAPA